MSATDHTAHGREPDADPHAEPDDADPDDAEPGAERGTQAGPPTEAAADLTQVVLDLADRIEALQADVRRLGGPGLPAAEPGWNDQNALPVAAPSYAWVSSIGAPVRRRPGVPRLLLEVLFLAAAATAAALADLDLTAIAAVMAGSWLLVALIEWAASRADARRHTMVALPAAASPPEPVPADPTWFVPPVEHTLLEPPADSPTAVTKLPPADLDATGERPPPA